jgi:succinoglycan biosynthesis transport protein ExoP
VSASADSNSLRHYLQMVLRRKWTILLPTLLVPAALIALSLRQETLYEASAQVVVNQGNVAKQLLTGIPDAGGDPQRILQTQAAVARSPAVAAKALADANVRSTTRLLAQSSVDVVPGADLLEFHVTDHDPVLATRLTTAYARAYTLYRSEADTAAIQAARQDILKRLQQFRTPEDRRSAAFANLLDREQQLRVVSGLEASNTYVLRPAGAATQIQPRPARSGVIGVILGLALGLGLTLLWEALDIRVRTADEVAVRLGLPLLARVPALPKGVRNGQRLVMLRAPSGLAAESFRILATNLDFVELDRKVRSIIVTSGAFSEGKSTVAANLAVTLARSGQRVAIVDLDLRRPTLDSFFQVSAAPGVTDVALDRLDLEDALVTISIGEAKNRDSSNGQGTSNGKASVFGGLEVLPSGAIPPNPGEFIASQPLRELLEVLHERADVVIVDAPAILPVGDAISLCAWADALLVVSRLGVARRPLLSELRRVLDTCPAHKLGVVVMGVAGTEGVLPQAHLAHYERPRKIRGESAEEVVRS